MDENVLAAMKRWPNVPDVYGWLSLSENGQWRLHPGGTACDARETGNGRSSGEDMGNATIAGFINRNYACDAKGNWYFQNGPQRVFVRLDAAPYILRTTGKELALVTHTGLAVAMVSAWVLDDTGRLYAQTEHGPGLIHGRDLPAFIDTLYTSTHEPLIQAVEHAPAPQYTPHTAHSITVRQRLATSDAADTPLIRCTAQAVAAKLGFIRFPAPSPSNVPDPEA